MTFMLFLIGCANDEAGDSIETEYEIDKKFERGPLAVHVKVDKSKISIADTIRLRLEATIEQGYEVDMPPLAEVLGEYQLAILDYRSLPDKLAEEDRLLLRRDYRLEPFVSGTYALPELKFIFREKNPPPDSAEEPGQYELLTEEIPIEVTSLLDDERGDLTLADIKDIAAPPQRDFRWWAWAGGAVVLAGAAVVLILLLRRRKVKQIRILKTAHQLAYERLQKLIDDNLVSAGRIKTFYERISNILRWYIEHRFDLKAPERTTEEFLQEVGSTQVLTAEQKEMLRRFLQHCDMVKFARYGPTKEEIQITFDLTREFIEATKIQQKQVDVTDQEQKVSLDTLLRSA